MKTQSEMMNKMSRKSNDISGQSTDKGDDDIVS
jgi:hypothetical protein